MRNSVAGATFNGSGPSNSAQSVPPNPADAPAAQAGPSAPLPNNSNYNQSTTVPIVGGFGDSQVFGNFLAEGRTVNNTGQARLPGVDGAAPRGRAG